MQKIVDERSTEMVIIPEGTFLMGTDSGEVYEGPLHEVYLPVYAIDIYPVTNALFHDFIVDSGYRAQGPWEKKASIKRRNHPVVNITWYDANEYTKWAGKRLPKETEWEKAARGVDGRMYPWGNKWSKSKCNCWQAGLKDTSPVGFFAEDCSPYGCFDMAGNVSEWLFDWATIKDYQELPYGSQGIEYEKNCRAGRGGNWFANASSDFRCATRGAYAANKYLDRIGFRCVRDTI